MEKIKFSGFQQRVLKALAESTNEWTPKSELQRVTEREKGYSQEIGRVRGNKTSEPDSLVGRELVDFDFGQGRAVTSREKDDADFRITEKGRVVWRYLEANDGKITPQQYEAICVQFNEANDLSKAVADLDDEGAFDPQNLSDERKKTLRTIALRQGQPEFRKQLLSAYDDRCAITRCDAVAALEAAHIIRYLGDKSNLVSNGLLLRADIHTLFDLNLIRINPETMRVSIAASLRGTCYGDLDKTNIFIPKDQELRPNAEALALRWNQSLTS